MENSAGYWGHSVLNAMNREQRERYEQRLLLSRLSVHSLEGRGTLLLGLFLEPHWNYKGHSVFRGERENSLFVENLLGTLRFFAIFACFAVRFIADTPF